MRPILNHTQTEWLYVRPPSGRQLIVTTRRYCKRRLKGSAPSHSFGKVVLLLPACTSGLGCDVDQTVVCIKRVKMLLGDLIPLPIAQRRCAKRLRNHSNH